MSINKATLRATFQPFITQASRHLHDQGLIPGLKNARDNIVNAIADFNTAKEAILSDLNLSVQGKAAKIQEIKRIATDRIDHVKDLSARLAEIEARIFAPSEKKSDIQQLKDEIRQAEIRRHYWTLEEIQLNPIVMNAIENGDDETTKALLSSPVPIFSSDALQKFRKDFAIKKFGASNPGIMAEYEDIELVNGLISGMKSTTHDYLK